MFLKKNNQPYSPLLIFSLETPQESVSLASVMASIAIYVESPEESNTFRPIENPVNSIDMVEEEVIDEESTGTIHLRQLMLLLLMTVMLSQETYFCNQNCCQRNLIEDTLDPQNMRKIIAGYISQTHRGWMCKICEKYLYSGVHQKELFLQGHVKTQLILTMHSVNMKGRKDIHV